MALTPFCDESEWEEAAKKRSKEEKLDGNDEDERCECHQDAYVKRSDVFMIKSFRGV